MIYVHLSDKLSNVKLWYFSRKEKKCFTIILDYYNCESLNFLEGSLFPISSYTIIITLALSLLKWQTADLE